MTRKRGLVLAAALLPLAWAAPATGLEGPSPPGRPAPPFRLKDLQGRGVDLEGLRGRLVVLHFGASW